MTSTRSHGRFVGEPVAERAPPTGRRVSPAGVGNGFRSESTLFDCLGSVYRPAERIRDDGLCGLGDIPAVRPKCSNVRINAELSSCASEHGLVTMAFRNGKEVRISVADVSSFTIRLCSPGSEPRTMFGSGFVYQASEFCADRTVASIMSQSGVFGKPTLTIFLEGGDTFQVETDKPLPLG